MTRDECILVMIQEECAEIFMACAKALRFGLGITSDKGSVYDNGGQLGSEIVDLLGLVEP